LGSAIKKTLRAAEQDQPKFQRARAAWRQRRLAWTADRLVFLDETGLNTKMCRLYGRSARGTRCRCAEPFGHWQSTTLIAALRLDRLTAPLLIKGPMDGAMFVAYLQQVLAPELRPGDLVICDNLSSHKVHGAAQAVAACGAELLYLPAYSPDLNPIEMAFAKLKAHLRQAGRRTLLRLQRATLEALRSFSADHCRNFFAHAEYATN
jgi:transposase